MTRRIRPASLWPWLAAAAALHALVSLLQPEGQKDETASFRAPIEQHQDLLEIDLLGQTSVGGSQLHVAAPDETGHELSVAPFADPEPKVASTLGSTRGSGTAGTKPAVGPKTRALQAEHNAATPSSLEVPAEPTTGTPSAPANADDSASAGPPIPPAPRHTLAELGYGTTNGEAIKPYLRVDPIANAQNRLDQNLAQAIIDRDRDRSNGIEGPVTQALHLAAMAVVAPQSSSKIAIIIGSNGKLADIQVISTNRDARALANLGARLKTLLANQTVRVPNGRAVEFTYEIKSDVLLPSGRAPGLGVEVLGIPLKEGRADNSSKISILTPKLNFESVSQPDPERNGKVTQTPPQAVVGFTVVGIDGDIVDLGANERQVVHTRLIRQRVL